MRNNYYDPGWNWPQGDGENKGPIKPGTAQPYGDVYDKPQAGTDPAQTGLVPPSAQPVGTQPVAAPLTATQPVAARMEQVIITRQEQLGTTPPIRTKKPRPRRARRGRTGVPGFIVCLLLLVGLTAGLVYAKGGVELSMPGGLWEMWKAWEGRYGSDIPTFPGLPGQDDPDGASGWDKFYYEWEERDWTESLKDTSIRKAPTGDGTVLTISGEAETLPPQSIYDKVDPTIVGIQVQQNWGYYSLGSGVIFSSDGYIVTNAHVIAGGSRAEVLLSDGTTLVASLVGYDKGYDLAVLKVKAPKGLPVAEFGDSDTLRVGDPAWAIGNPLGMELRGTMTDGMISAIDRQVGADNGTMTLIQTTAALNSGNSGGALINAAGQVVGITNMKMMSDEETIEGLGFAIPSRSVKEVVDQIVAQGYYDDGVPLLGITVSTILPDGKTPGGAYVVSVEPTSDAYKKGIRPGDIIVSANGKTVTDINGLLAAKTGLEVGEALTVEIWREKGNITVDIVLMTRHQMDEAG